MEKNVKQVSRRTSLLKKNILASILIKGWSALVVLLMVPLTLKMLGVYHNGIWLTISSVLVWMDLMDIGLGNGLRNAVAYHLATNEQEKVKEAVSSAFFALTCIVLPLLLLLYVFITSFDMYAVLGIEQERMTELNTILAVAVTFTSSAFILKTTGNFYMGLQLPAVNNLIVSIGQTLSLIVTFIAYLAQDHSLFAVVAINTATPLLVWTISFLYTFKWKYPQYCPSLKMVSIGMSKNLCSTGIQFFILQICGVVLFMSANVIISKLFSPAEVTPYQVAYRYFNLILVVFTTICMPFWNATTDAYARGDTQWLYRAGRKLNQLIIGLTLTLIVMIVFADLFYKNWIGTEVTIPKDLSIAMALYIYILCLSQRYSYILNGLNELKIQLIFTLAATTIFIPLATVASKSYGSVTGLVGVMCVVNVPGILANRWKYHQILYKKSATL